MIIVPTYIPKKIFKIHTSASSKKNYFQHGDDCPAAPGPERERRERPVSVRPAQRDAPLFRGPYCERIPRLLRTVPLAGGSALPGVVAQMDV
jgi:hypothetical protein